MQLELVEKGKNTVTINMHEQKMTVVNPLISELLKDDAVDDVIYIDTHPELHVPSLTVVVKSGKPQTALKRAAKSLSSQYKEARKQVLKQI